ncbi:MAG: PTS sugar transporter subunit IIA [bacterium]|nr:PTS sugar transporter subunit IIA [bacterium]
MKLPDVVSAFFLSSENLSSSVLEMSEKCGFSQEEAKIVEKRVLERENLFSTYYSDEVIVPRAITEKRELILCAGVLKKSFVYFEDEIRIVFLLLYPKDKKADYLYVLSSLYRILSSKQFIAKLAANESEEDLKNNIMKALHEIES